MRQPARFSDFQKIPNPTPPRTTRRCRPLWNEGRGRTRTTPVRIVSRRETEWALNASRCGTTTGEACGAARDRETAELMTLAGFFLLWRGGGRRRKGGRWRAGCGACAPVRWPMGWPAMGHPSAWCGACGLICGRAAHRHTSMPGRAGNSRHVREAQGGAPGVPAGDRQPRPGCPDAGCPLENTPPHY